MKKAGKISSSFLDDEDCQSSSADENSIFDKNKIFLYVVLLFAGLLFLLININFSLAKEYSLKVTEEHPFFVGGKWLVASELKVGDELTTADGKKAKITHIEDVVLDKPISVYNLEALPFHDFVLQGNVVVHNSNFEGLKVREKELSSSEIADIINRLNNEQFSSNELKIINTFNKMLKIRGLAELEKIEKIYFILASYEPKEIWKLIDFFVHKRCMDIYKIEGIMQELRIKNILGQKWSVEDVEIAKEIGEFIKNENNNLLQLTPEERTQMLDGWKKFVQTAYERDLPLSEFVFLQGGGFGEVSAILNTLGLKGAEYNKFFSFIMSVSPEGNIGKRHVALGWYLLAILKKKINTGNLFSNSIPYVDNWRILLKSDLIPSVLIDQDRLIFDFNCQKPPKESLPPYLGTIPSQK